MAGRHVCRICRPVSVTRLASWHGLTPMIRHLKGPNLASVIARGRGLGMIFALYFGLSAVYGNGPRQEAFAAHAYAGLTVLGLVVIRLFALMLLTPLTGWIVASSMGCIRPRTSLSSARSPRLMQISS